ncbi:hypothetical protein [Roseivirga pacifica]|uniref:hypothetical protein n=1 Tax=Roseivirga pacifica TaxID=1267423 RepID=UPI002094755A|nr:hypothetical protein [Roseivirga pacifica]MCO6358537.1 hypothetical protein [Roseivirga pacifica]MCO6369092.1 hypothetical protein [Roseivirga pacifica]MCO6372204.1 hypothetical protein [Roseivirga pacifica]MCO6374268.1 hypothetical protein [Roseivirga pacifica]MCO6380935.1 hypothetical protein [Roseivirga pacifica]
MAKKDTAKVIVLDFDKPVLNMKGESLGHLGDTLAIMLEQRQGGNQDKWTDWAEQLYNKEPLQLDRADRADLEAWVLKSQAFAISKRRLLEVIKQKDE